MECHGIPQGWRHEVKNGSGDNPFKAAPGASFTTALTTFATGGLLGVLVLPELVLAVVGAATRAGILG